MTEGLIGDVQGGFRAGRGRVDQIFTLKEIGEKAREKNVEFMWVLWTWIRYMIGSIGKHYGYVLRMNHVGGKLLNGIKIVYVNSLACVRVKGCESKCFRADNGVR